MREHLEDLAVSHVVFFWRWSDRLSVVRLTTAKHCLATGICIVT